jgi:hypothetical protein
MPVQRPQLPSCLTGKDPFIKLGAGKAPVLNYSLPQRTSFASYGDISLKVGNDWFKPDATEEPDDVKLISALPAEELKQKILDDYIYPNTGKPSYIKLLDGLDLGKVKQELVLNQPPDVAVAAMPVNFEYLDEGGGGIGDVGDGGGGGGIGGDVPVKPLPAVTVGKSYIDHLIHLIKIKRFAAVAVPKFGNYGSQVQIVPRPPVPQPVLYIIEEYKTTSFLGDYGAGETVKTFSLLPGEKHTITVRSFREKTSTQMRSDNVMDSFSQSSAKEFENLLQEEKQTQNSESTSKGKQSGGSIGLSIKWLSLGGNKSKSSSSTATRASNSSSLSKALQKHSDSTNANRQITVNTTTSDSQRESLEESSVREIVNPNLSRVLNFVFRQLLQEYVSITYLNDIKIAYNNGHPESFKVVSIEELDDLLNEVLLPEHHQAVRQMIWHEYHEVENHLGNRQVFLEEKQTTDFDGSVRKHFHKRKNLTDTYLYPGADGDMPLSVEGVILNVDLNTLRTDSLVTDALLGQGEALDCFNSHAQEAKTQAMYLDNANKELQNARQEVENAKAQAEKQRLDNALSTLAAISDPVKRAELMALIFNPQVVNIERNYSYRMS